MRIPTIVATALLVSGLAGCGNGDDAKQQAKNGDMKGVRFGDPIPEPPMPEPPKPPPDILQVKPNPPPKGLVQNVRAAAYRPDRQNELKNIGFFFNDYVTTHNRNPATDEDFLKYMERDAPHLAKAIREKYYVLNLKAKSFSSNSVIAYETLTDQGGYQAVRGDCSVEAIREDELRKLIMQQ